VNVGSRVTLAMAHLHRSPSPLPAPGPRQPSVQDRQIYETKPRSVPFSTNVIPRWPAKGDAAPKIRNALEKVYRTRDKLTRDVGKAGTSEFANSIMWKPCSRLSFLQDKRNAFKLDRAGKRACACTVKRLARSVWSTLVRAPEIRIDSMRKGGPCSKLKNSTGIATKYRAIVARMCEPRSLRCSVRLAPRCDGRAAITDFDRMRDESMLPA